MEEKVLNALAAEDFITNELRRNLPANLYYHGLHHTLDVTRAAMALASLEGFEDQESLLLLKTAALYHDCGFMHTYQNHEEAGCKIVKDALPAFGYSASQIEIICSMIQATKLPQNPQTHLEKILCDADLDYLGRDDYEPIAQTLFLELSARNLISGPESWHATQVKFLAMHQYWTDSARKSRENIKQRHLHELMSV